METRIFQGAIWIARNLFARFMNASRDNDIISSRRERKREKGSNQTCVVIILDPLLSLWGRRKRNKQSRRKKEDSGERFYPFIRPSFQLTRLLLTDDRGPNSFRVALDRAPNCAPLWTKTSCSPFQKEWKGKGKRRRRKRGGRMKV